MPYEAVEAQEEFQHRTMRQDGQTHEEDDSEGRFDQHDDAILVGAQPFARAHDHPLHDHGYLGLALVALVGRQGHQGQRADADVAGRQFGDIAHRAVDDDAGPAVARRRSGQVAADQRAAQRAPAVDHQHAALAGGVERGLDQRIVFVALDGGHRAGKARARAEAAEDRRQHAKGAIAVVLVRVAQVAGGDGGGGHGKGPLAGVGGSITRCSRKVLRMMEVEVSDSSDSRVTTRSRWATSTTAISNIQLSSPVMFQALAILSLIHI